MGRNTYIPYGLNIEYEFKTYSLIGQDYGDRKTANLRLIGNLIRFLRKKNNKGEKKYATCDTRSDWERHVESVLPSGNCNYKDLLFWLNSLKRKVDILLEITQILIIPLYLAVLGIFLSDYVEPVPVFLRFLIILVLIIYPFRLQYRYKMKAFFYEDFIAIANKKYENVT